MKMDIGFSYAAKMGRIPEELKARRMEFQIFRSYRDDVPSMRELFETGYKIESVHLPHHDFYDTMRFRREIERSLLDIKKNVPSVKQAVIHPPEVRGDRDKLIKEFLSDMSRIAGQTDLIMCIENVKGKLIDTYKNIQSLNESICSLGLEYVGIVLDTSHIRVTNQAKENTDKMIRFIEACGSSLKEVHVSEPARGVSGKYMPHYPVRGDVYEWDRIFPPLADNKVQMFIEVMEMDQVSDSLAYITRKEPKLSAFRM